MPQNSESDVEHRQDGMGWLGSVGCTDWEVLRLDPALWVRFPTLSIRRQAFRETDRHRSVNEVKLDPEWDRTVNSARSEWEVLRQQTEMAAGRVMNSDSSVLRDLWRVSRWQ